MKCPSLISIDKRLPVSTYASWSKDPLIYKTSTSGGIATVLANYIIGQGGVVYGSSMLPGINVKHIRIDRIQDVCKLQGSKYVQSDIKDCFQQIRNDLKFGKKVLFIGCPCQVAAVKSVFNKKCENLYLIDLICHGVPSLCLLKKYVQKVLRKEIYNEVVSFREGNEILFKIIKENALIYKMTLYPSRYRDWYINTFMDGFTYRDSCYKCQYARPERISDITIGDFWGIGVNESATELISHPYGCSLVLPCTSRGEELINKVSPLLLLYKRTFTEAITGNDQLRAPKKKSFRIRIFRTIQFFPFLYITYYVIMLDKIFQYYGRFFLRHIILGLKISIYKQISFFK